MAYIGSHHRHTAWISARTDFAVKLGRVALPPAPSFEEIIFIRIKLASTQGARGGQRWLWCLSEILAHRITGHTQFFSDHAQAHPSGVQLMYPLIELPFAQEARLRLPLAGRGGRKRGEGLVWHVLLLRRGFRVFQTNMSTNQELLYRIAQVREDVPPVCDLSRLGCALGGSIDIDSSPVSTDHIHFWVSSQPCSHALCLPVGQQIHNFVRLQVHKNTAEALAAPPTPIIHSDDSHLTNLGERNQKQGPEHGRIGKAHR